MHCGKRQLCFMPATFIQTARPNKAAALGLEEAGERLFLSFAQIEDKMESCGSTPVFIHRHPAEFLSESCSNVAI